MRTVNPATVPRPQFELFEVALLIFRDSEGFYSGGVIQIMGMEYDPPNSNDQGWWYHAHDLVPREEPWLDDYLREPCPESLLFKLQRKGCLLAGNEANCHTCF